MSSLYCNVQYVSNKKTIKLRTHFLLNVFVFLFPGPESYCQQIFNREDGLKHKVTL
jgi:hypothetical protein